MSLRGVMKMLKIENLSVSYGPRHVLEAISLEVNSGEVLALIGPNGAGKSTLLKALIGIVQVPNGEISFNSSIVGFIICYLLISQVFF